MAVARVTGPPVTHPMPRVEPSVSVEAGGRAERHEPPLGGARGDEPEERPVERVDPGRDDADPPEAEREDRVLAVARVVVRRRRRGSATARFACPPNRSWSAASRWAAGSSGCQASSSQRAPTSVSARPWMRPCARYVGAQALVVAQVAVVAEREPAGRVVERLGVGQGQGRETRRTAEVDEGRRRLGPADGLPARVVAEGPDVAVRREPPAPSVHAAPQPKPGDPEPLQLLDERPQLVEPERVRGPGDEVLTHRAR